ncbi:unnamed protein product [Cladocopium goreaui]|uniref:Cyclomaltodextrin glucanotransferase (Cyclodextrin-glycosyltransferase) (CGTase) n=1 Tax=Cladocopium goreaui TaxID=2562237 RepID=A0A9P1CR43_9DINO|nr:unnamed protein product [Cladocopium goreaui]
MWDHYSAEISFIGETSVFLRAADAADCSGGKKNSAGPRDATCFAGSQDQRDLREFVQSMLNRGIHRHVEKYGCYANRDICKLVREAGLHIALEQRSHFGTTYSLVCTKSPLVKAVSSESSQMPRQVSFSVKCADTRVGLHVRVVGSVAALGEWDPQKGLVLNTSASDFPNWKQTEPTPLEEGKVVEYKYVICDNNGAGVRWEERANRTLHIADLVEREMVPPNGWIAITENFVAYDCDEMRFRLWKRWDGAMVGQG